MYNQLKNCTEFRKRNTHDDFIRIDQRGMNTLCLEAKKQGINCWDRDVSRFVYFFQIPSYPSLITPSCMPNWKLCWTKVNDIGWTRKKKLPGKSQPIFLSDLCRRRCLQSLLSQTSSRESIETYSAAEIYRRLKQKSPESMRNISVQRLAQTLSAIGIERIHTRYGNLYRVVSHPSQ